MKKRNEEAIIIKYRWEFLRRNKQYQRDYSNKGKFPKKYWRMRYDIPIAWDPQQALSEVNASKSKTVKFFFESDLKPLPPIVLINLRNKPIDDKDSDREDVLDIFLNEEGKDAIDEVSVLNLLVDLTQKKETIISQFKKLISYWKNIRKTKNQVRFDEYNKYLKVYDFKEKGWSWERLAGKFFESDMIRDKEYAKRKVKRYYNRCRKMIEGGYRQIR